MQTRFNTSIGPATEFLYGKRANIRLGFGCAGLLHLPSRRRRQRLLCEAFELGIRHFDVARMYGLGAAESEVGRFAKGRRDQIAIATKFGIEPPGPLMAKLQAPARAAIEKLPAMQGALKRAAGARARGGHEPRRYDGELARRSLETSLRELGTEYVDCFFVHDPRPVDEVDLESIRSTCEDLVQSGKVRAWGISGEPDPCTGMAATGGTMLLQVRDEVFAPATAARASEPPAIGFGILSSALARIEAHLAADEVAKRRWSEAIGCECADPAVLAALLIREALDRNRHGGILVATSRPSRLPIAIAAAEAAQRADGDPVAAAFRKCVEQDFRIVTAVHA